MKTMWWLLGCVGPLLGVMNQAATAQIVLSQPRFEAGQKFAAFFKVQHGCGESPTVALRVQMPADVTVLDTPQKPGWNLGIERDKGRITAVTWRGRLDAKTVDQFGLLVNLPPHEGALYFPSTQQCEKGEARWIDIPAAGQNGHSAHPAPMLQLTAATTPASYMAGNIMIEQVWSTATPGGARTGAAYMTITNHGTVPDTLLGGSSPVAGGFEIHQMSMANGIMTMRPEAGGIAIPAGAMVTLGPQANYHVMLTGLKEPLKEGTHVPATLNFAKAGAVQVELAVAPIGARAPAGASGTMGAMPGMDHH
ncbi:MAG TPA: copper chaperone PCu(A)C [Micropepsaceae bacterium]|nr:copper chaperone PCu(A)C [Micropepsaceae bacterium]